MNQSVFGPLLVFVLANFSIFTFASSSAQAQNEGYDCITEGQGDLLCLALPSGGTEVEDQASRNLQAQETRKTETQGRKVSMLTQADLTASTSLESEFDRESTLDPATVAEQRVRTKTLAEVEAMRANQQVRDLYIFLNLTDRTGGTGDTSVISAGTK